MKAPKIRTAADNAATLAALKPPTPTAPHCGKPTACAAGSCQYPQPCDAQTVRR
jgi:hypothetical protein